MGEMSSAIPQAAADFQGSRRKCVGNRNQDTFAARRIADLRSRLKRYGTLPALARATAMVQVEASTGGLRQLVWLPGWAVRPVRARMSLSEQHRTPLHHAAAKSRPRMVRLLLDLGADPNASDAVGMTALTTASREHADHAIVTQHGLGRS
jgi:hypothetical protein